MISNTVHTFTAEFLEKIFLEKLLQRVEREMKAYEESSRERYRRGYEIIPDEAIEYDKYCLIRGHIEDTLINSKDKKSRERISKLIKELDIKVISN